MARKPKVTTLETLTSDFPWLKTLIELQKRAIESTKTALIGSRALSCGSYSCALSEKWTGETDDAGLEPFCAVHKSIVAALIAIEETEPFETKK